MPSTSAFVAFAALSFALIVVPGPSVLFVVSRGVTLGRRAALWTVLGNAVGVYLQVVAVAFGLAVIVERSMVAFDAVKLVGALYLVWLGVQAIRRRNDKVLPDGAGAVRARHSVLFDGLVVGFANPKAIVFFAAILPQYVDPDGAAPAGVQMAALGAVFVAIALVSDSAWGLAAGTARHWFSQRPRRVERLGVVGGLTMIGLGAHLALTGRRT